MAIPLANYKRIKDRYCIGYFDNDTTVIQQLQDARALIEETLPGIQIYIAHSNELSFPDEKCISLHEFDECRAQFAYFRTISGPNCVVKLLEESGITRIDTFKETADKQENS